MTSADPAAVLVRLAAPGGIAHDVAGRVADAAVLVSAERGEVTALTGDDSAWLVVRARYADVDQLADAVLARANLADQVRWRWRGREQPGLTGPAPGPGGIAVVAVRHLRDAEAARSVLDLLERSGADWKATFEGFVAATPFLGDDGRTLVNHPRWSDRAAYDAWMAEPRMRAGQRDVGRHEVAPPEYHLLTVRRSSRLRTTPRR